MQYEISNTQSKSNNIKFNLSNLAPTQEPLSTNYAAITNTEYIKYSWHAKDHNNNNYNNSQHNNAKFCG